MGVEAAHRLRQTEQMRAASERWLVYALVSRDRSRTYVGISTDPVRRLDQHNGLLAGGAKSTRAGRPWSLGAVYGPYPDRAEAQRLERVLKSLNGVERLSLEPGSAPDPSAVESD
jgi:predicted GIY-YIG superfamily endonuclease